MLLAVVGQKCVQTTIPYGGNTEIRREQGNGGVSSSPTDMPDWRVMRQGKSTVVGTACWRVWDGASAVRFAWTSTPQTAHYRSDFCEKQTPGQIVSDRSMLDAISCRSMSTHPLNRERSPSGSPILFPSEVHADSRCDLVLPYTGQGECQGVSSPEG